jgi:hypothetical protein
VQRECESGKGGLMLTGDERRAGLLRLGEAAQVSPHLRGCFREGRVDVGEHGPKGVVRGIKEHEMGLDLEGI